MDRSARHLDMFLRAIRPDALMLLAQSWGAPASTSPEAALATILAVLNDLPQLQRLVGALSAQEQTALALVKFMSGASDAEALTAALRVLGFPCPASDGRAVGDPLIDLVQRGLLLHDSLYDPLTVSTRYGPCRLVADDRLLAHVPPITVVPLPLDPVPPPPAPASRAPAGVTLDVLTSLRTIEHCGGFKPTSTGALRVADVRRLSRALGWPDAGPVIAGVPFANAVHTLIMILWSAGVLAWSNGTFVPSPEAAAFCQQSYTDQIRALLQGGMRSQRWQEWPNPPWSDGDGHRQVQWRLVLLSALMALPPGGAFVAITDLADALFARIGRAFSLTGPVQLPYLYGKSLTDTAQATRRWQAQLHHTWHEREQVWITRALATWLTWLGVVEVGLVDGAPMVVRLTDIGRAIFQPWQIAPADADPQLAPPAWVVQPNFEILVYLDRVPADLLPLLAQQAERIQVEPHIARYRLTHETVYTGLERGGTLDGLFAALRRGAGAELPGASSVRRG
jgi:hypothetical protein